MKNTSDSSPVKHSQAVAVKLQAERKGSENAGQDAQSERRSRVLGIGRMQALDGNAPPPCPRATEER
jgi:hypothetical protein